MTSRAPTQRRHRSRGFTIVELLIAMAGLSILMLAIAIFLISVSRLYQKGLTLRAANEAGQLVVGAMGRELNGANSATVAAVTDASGGRLCVGPTVFAWNYGSTITSDDPDALNSYPDGPTEERRNLRFVSFTAPPNTFCVRDGGGHYPPMVSRNQVTELITGGDADLALHEFTLASSKDTPPGLVAGDGSQTMYRTSFVIGTPSEGLIDSNRSCAAPAGSELGDEYCAVNQFTFTARAGSQEGGSV